MRHRLMWVIALIPLIYSSSVEAKFTGNFELNPKGCEDSGKCKLTYDLLFTDPQGLEWQADAKDTTDGASIPPWAQPFVGKPFDPSYIKAAVIHDHYCDRHVRKWRATHRMFFDALIDEGLSPAKAKLMYYAVYLGGPKWTELRPGKNCGTGKACTNQVEIGAVVNGISDDQKVFITRGAQYDLPGFDKELQTVDKMLEADDQISLEDLEQRAKTIRPNDFFYENAGELNLDGGLQLK